MSHVVEGYSFFMIYIVVENVIEFSFGLLEFNHVPTVDQKIIIKEAVYDVKAVVYDDNTANYFLVCSKHTYPSHFYQTITDVTKLPRP